METNAAPAPTVVEAWTLQPGMAVFVPGYPTANLIMDVQHLPRFDKIAVTFDTGLVVRIVPSAFIRTV